MYISLCEQAYIAFHILSMHVRVIHIPPTQSDKDICIKDTEEYETPSKTRMYACAAKSCSILSHS